MTKSVSFSYTHNDGILENLQHVFKIHWTHQIDQQMSEWAMENWDEDLMVIR